MRFAWAFLNVRVQRRKGGGEKEEKGGGEKESEPVVRPDSRPHAPPSAPREMEATLRACLSADGGTRRAGERAMEEAERVDPAGHLAGLLQIARREIGADSSGAGIEDASVAHLAAVALKRAIARAWRDARLLSAEAKTAIRSGLLAGCEASDPRVAVQMAGALARVARHDVPGRFPELFPALIHKLVACSGPGSTESAVEVAVRRRRQRRVLFALHCAIKELDSKRLPVARRVFAALARDLLHPLWSVAQASGEALVAAAPSSLDEAVCEPWLLSLKCLRRVLVSGLPPDTDATHEAMATALPALAQMLAAVHAAALPWLVAHPHPADQAGVGWHADARGEGASAAAAASLVRRGLGKILRTMEDAVHRHPWSFTGPSLEPLLTIFMQAILTTEPPPSPFPSSPLIPGGQRRAQGEGGEGEGHVARVVVAGSIKVMQAVVLSPAYRSEVKEEEGGREGGREEGREGATAHARREAQGRLATFFGAGPHSRACALARALISTHLLLSPADISTWQEDPEAFHASHAPGGASFQNPHVAVRGSASGLLCALLETFKPETLSALGEAVGMLRESQQQAAATAEAEGGRGRGRGRGEGGLAGAWPAGEGWKATLAREAVYTAMTLAAYDLHGSLAFADFFQSTLTPELSPSPAGREGEGKGGGEGAAPLPLHALAQRAALYLMGAWVADVPEGMRPAVYAVVTSAMGADDPAVALAACACLRAFVDDWSFYEDAFVPFLPNTLTHLGRLAVRCEDLDAQAQAFGALALVTERMGRRIRPFAATLAPALAEVWHGSCGHQSLVKIQILACMHRLMGGAGREAGALCLPAAMPMLTHAVDPNNPEAPVIMEDGLVLLRAALQHCPSLDACPALAALCGPVLAHVGRSTEHLATCCDVLEAFVVAGGPAFVAMHHAALFNTAAAAVQAVNGRGLCALAPWIDAAIMQVLGRGNEGARMAAPALGAIVARVVEAGKAAQGHGDGDSDEAVAAACGVLARAAVGAPGAVVSLLACGGAEGVGVVVGAWMGKAYALASAAKRSMAAAGLVLCLETSHPLILFHADAIVSFAWETHLGAAPKKGGPEGGPGGKGGEGGEGSVGVWGEGEGDEGGDLAPASEETWESERRRRLWHGDPLRGLNIGALALGRVGVCSPGVRDRILIAAKATQG